LLPGVPFLYLYVLLFLGQPKVVSELAGRFTLYLLPGVPFLYLYELLKRLLQAQNIASPMLIVALIGNIINITVGYYLVHYTSMGYLVWQPHDHSATSLSQSYW